MSNNIANCKFARYFSTSNTLRQLVPLPTQVFGVEGRYASALYSAAVKNKTIDQVDSDINKLQNLLNTEAVLQTFIRNPSLQKAVKGERFLQVLAHLKCTDLTKNMFAVLGENGRLALTTNVMQSFLTLMIAHRGEVSCEVTTAKPLDKATEKELRTTLSAFLKPGEVLNLNMKEDPTIVGGMIVSIGDRYVDMSIAKRLRVYKQALESVF